MQHFFNGGGGGGWGGGGGGGVGVGGVHRGGDILYALAKQCFPWKIMQPLEEYLNYPLFILNVVCALHFNVIM